MFRQMLIAGLALGMVPVQARAQDWRNVTSFRQRAQESRLDVHVRYGAGMLSILPGGAGELYRTDIRYDSDTFEPVTDYRSDTRPSPQQTPFPRPRYRGRGTLSWVPRLPA